MRKEEGQEVRYPLKIGFDLLKKQKAWLLEHEEWEAEGLVGIIDALQEHAVKIGLGTREEIYAVKEEERSEE